MITIPLNSYFELRSSKCTHSYNLRHRRAEQTIIYRTKYALKSLQYRTPFVWNSIPDNLKCCETLASFKKQMKSHFLELQGTEGNVSLLSFMCVYFFLFRLYCDFFCDAFFS